MWLLLFYMYIYIYEVQVDLFWSRSKSNWFITPRAKMVMFLNKKSFDGTHS